MFQVKLTVKLFEFIPSASVFIQHMYIVQHNQRRDERTGVTWIWPTWQTCFK